MIGSKRIWICLFWQISSYMFFEFDYQTKNCELQLLSVKSLFEFSCCLGQRAVVSVYGETRSIFIVAVNDVIACGDSIISSSSSSSSFSSSSFSSFSSSSFFQKNGGWGYRCQTGNPQPWIVPGEIFCLCVSPGSRPMSRFTSSVPIHPGWQYKELKKNGIEGGFTNNQHSDDSAVMIWWVFWLIWQRIRSMGEEP